MSWLQKECVVVPIDFSEDSFQAIDVAREFVQESSHLHLIHITQRGANMTSVEPGARKPKKNVCSPLKKVFGNCESLDKCSKVLDLSAKELPSFRTPDPGPEAS